MAGGMKSSPNVHSANDCVFFCTIIIIACVIMDNAHYNIFGWVGSTMTMLLMIEILTHHWMWRDKRWETSLCMCAPFFEVIVVIVSWRILWDAMCSSLHRHQSKWIPKPSMVSPLWQCERCAIIGCGKSRWVCNVVRKWAEDKWNVGVVRWINNQLPTVGPAQDQPVHVVSKGAFIRNVKNSYSCKQSIKKNL